MEAHENLTSNQALFFGRIELSEGLLDIQCDLVDGLSVGVAVEIAAHRIVRKVFDSENFPLGDESKPFEATGV